MNYHLNRDGQNLGVFSKEELQGRRATGELTGAELVWTEGMTAWQPLHSVLPLLPPPPISGLPPATQKSGSNRLAIMAAIVGGAASGRHGIGSGGIPNDPAPGNQALGGAAFGCHRDTVGPVGGDGSGGQAGGDRCEYLDGRRGDQSQPGISDTPYVEGYKLRGERNPECDALALGLVSNWIACNYGGDVDTNLPPLSELGDRLANDPACTDPFLTKAGQMLF